MSDLICRKTMMRCQTPGMCSPFGGCRAETTISQADNDRIVAELNAVIDQRNGECSWKHVEIEGLREERDALLVKVTDLRAEVELMTGFIIQHRAQADQYDKALQAVSADRDRFKEEVERLRKDAERYQWLRAPNIDVSLVLDKVIGEQPRDEFGGGGYKMYEYRAGDELDEAIYAAMEASRCL